MKATRKARDRARQSNAEKFERLHRQVEAEAVILDLIDEQEELDSKFGKAIDVLRSMGVKAGEIEESTGITGIQQSKFLKAWQDVDSDDEEDSTDQVEDEISINDDPEQVEDSEPEDSSVVDSKEQEFFETQDDLVPEKKKHNDFSDQQD